MKFKKGDLVLITSGKDKGKRGQIEAVLSKEDTVLIPGLNIFKRHVKKGSKTGQSGIIDFPRPVQVGNIALICPKCKEQTRIGFNISKKEKIRVCKKCNKPL